MGYKGSRGVFGYPPHRCYDLIYMLEKELGTKFSVLIPDCYDGYCVMPMILRGKTVDCYETNDILINGGIIDKYYTIGLKQKIFNTNLQKNSKIYKSNFYLKNKIDIKYDYVYCYRSLHLDRNKDIKMSTKIRKLLSSVKTNGYVYILYYLAENKDDYEKYPSNSYLREKEMREYFDFNNWDIIFNIEGHKRMHGPHPFHNKEHYHNIGVILARKKNTRKKQIYRYMYTIY